MIGLKINNYAYFYPLKGVGRVSETQLQVDRNKL